VLAFPLLGTRLAGRDTGTAPEHVPAGAVAEY
jgi:hypothetical protein